MVERYTVLLLPVLSDQHPCEVLRCINPPISMLLDCQILPCVWSMYKGREVRSAEDPLLYSKNHFDELNCSENTSSNPRDLEKFLHSAIQN